ncbi:MAG TPA: carboxymuconolactone decarboxylase family protein [Rhizomicrobium sp.]
MIKELFDKGLKIRKEVLGREYVEKSLAAADEFSMPMQEMATESCWGYIWGREGLARRDRSVVNLAMISVLNRPHELKIHVKAALRNGVTKKEISEIFLQVACYAGIPCGVDSFRIAKEAIGEYEAESK